MVEREDSIHIKIKIDVDADDKAFVENLSSEIARADEKQASQPQRHVKSEKDQTDKEIIDLENEIKEIKDRLKKGLDTKDPEALKAKLEAKKNSLLIKEWKQGPVGTVASFTTEQTSNLKKFVTNPAEILVSAFTKKLGKIGGAAAKGGLIAIIALLVYETVLFVIDQFMQPGRWLDRRFKRLARIETMNFYERTLQEEIRHGYQEIRVTTMEGLRGGASQVNGNFFEFSSGATGILQSSPYRSSQDIYKSQNASGAVTDTQGNPRKRSVFFSGR